MITVLRDLLAPWCPGHTRMGRTYSSARRYTATARYKVIISDIGEIKDTVKDLIIVIMIIIVAIIDILNIRKSVSAGAVSAGRRMSVVSAAPFRRFLLLLHTSYLSILVHHRIKDCKD